MNFSEFLKAIESSKRTVENQLKTNKGIDILDEFLRIGETFSTSKINMPSLQNQIPLAWDLTGDSGIQDKNTYKQLMDFIEAEQAVGASGAGKEQIVDRGRFIDYTNLSGNKIRIPKQPIKTIYASIAAKLKSPYVGEQTEAKVADFIKNNTSAEITDFSNKIKTVSNDTVGDIDIATKNKIIEVKKSISDVGINQLGKYIDRTNTKYFNFENKDVILYVDELIEANNKNVVSKLEKINKLGIPIINNLEDLKGVIK